MTERLFKVLAVTKTAQKNAITSFDAFRLYKGTPSQAAKKAFYHTCKQINKGVYNRCTLSVTVVQVKKTSIAGIDTVQPVLDSNGKPFKYKYAIKLERYHPKSSKGKNVVFENSIKVTFKFKTKIVKSFGRV